MRLWIPALGSLGLMGLHWLVGAYVPMVAIGTYFGTVGSLEFLERCGLPTLTGSESGWPLPTTFGYVLSAVGWFTVYFVATCIVAAVVRYFRRAHAREAHVV